PRPTHSSLCRGPDPRPAYLLRELARRHALYPPVHPPRGPLALPPLPARGLPLRNAPRPAASPGVLTTRISFGYPAFVCPHIERISPPLPGRSNSLVPHRDAEEQ